MRLPRTETTLAAVLLTCAAPFALAVPPGATAPNTPGVTPPETTPSTTNPGMTPPEATSPGATQPGTEPGTASPGMATTPQSSQSQSRTRSQDLQRGSASGWSRSHAQARSAEQVPKADIAEAKSAKVSLTDAINTAQQQNHGDVVSARFELHQGKPEYLIKTFNSQSRQEWVGHIDASTGKMIGQGRTIALSSLPKEDQQELTASQSAGTTLGQAVQTAEQQRGGKALAAGLSARNGHVSYKTELLKSNGRTQMAMVNPKSGQVSSYR